MRVSVQEQTALQAIERGRGTDVPAPTLRGLLRRGLAEYTPAVRGRSTLRVTDAAREALR